MPEPLALLLVLAAVFVTATLAWRQALRARARARLEADRPPAAGAPAPERPPVDLTPVLRRWPWAPLACAAATALALGPGLGLRAPLALALAFVAGTLAWLLEGYLAEQAARRLEEALVDGLDLIVAALRAGAGLLDALDGARAEARGALRPLLEETIGRVRLGDDPAQVFHDLQERAPLESFRLVAFTLSVHWETGGSLAPTLSQVGRAIRDRIELKRRVDAQATQARVSAVVFLGLAWFVAFVMWRSDPARLLGFARSSLGGALVVGAVVLQAVGLVWMARVSRLDV